jgi:putative RNA 2'-phosphotransferase
MKEQSRKISYLLRHNPEDLKMDRRGWVSVEDLLKKLDITQEDLDEVVINNNKKRFGYNSDKSRIRAHQGHSAKLNLRIEHKEVFAPGKYYHGTVTSNVPSILRKGLKPMSRAQVHLSRDVMTATMVGSRHGANVTILIVDGGRMKLDGYKIYESDNNVILTDEVPSKYIKIWQD